MEHTDVVIIGAGGAGMMAALTLAKAGRSCVVLEKGKHLSVSNAARAGGPSLADTLCRRRKTAPFQQKCCLGICMDFLGAPWTAACCTGVSETEGRLRRC